jgi:alkanesulfonate monooxygenase SsuD/methylene tetrahydromethanopterin reductase-like flavin-dependent oxidoreductase (luciferase family)
MAEQLNFDIAWFAEHHFPNYSMCPSPLMMASYCAPLTNRLRLGPAVLVLPLYHPVRMVEELALLDIQSNGRLVIGLGSGYQEYEFSGFALDIEDKLGMTHEAWDILEMGLGEGEVGYEGRFFNLPHRALVLRCVQETMPEIFVAGVNPSLVERVARSGYTPFISTGFRGIGKLEELRAQVEKSFHAVNGDQAPIPLAVQRYIYVTNSRKDALDAAQCARFVGRTVANMVAGAPQLDGAFLKPLSFDGEPSLEEIVENLNIGDPETIAKKMVEEIRLAQPTHYSCFFCFGPMDGKRALRSMERFGAEVVPLVEQAVGPFDKLNETARPPAMAAGLD